MYFYRQKISGSDHLCKYKNLFRLTWENAGSWSQEYNRARTGGWGGGGRASHFLKNI